MHFNRALVSVATLSSIVIASPHIVKRQNLDLGAILGAPVATLTGPPLAAINQTSVINTAATLASITAAITDVAVAQITGIAAANAANMLPSIKKRDSMVLQKRTTNWMEALMNMLGLKISSSGKIVAASTTSKTATTAAAVATTPATTAARTTSTTSTLNTPAAAYVVTTSATSTRGSTSTTTTSSTSACPTTPEDGTYCGFINPEDPCAPQPSGAGPAVNSPDTTDAWYNYAPFQTMAAQASAPAGYKRTFNNMNASSSANSYMGLWTLDAYDPAQCAGLCNNNTGCTAFNLYIERDPAQNPCKNDSTDATVWGYWCPMPKSLTNYKCTLWGSNLDASTATNAGGWRRDFPVVITGSNGYDKTNDTVPVAVATYDAPKNCSGKAINGGSYWLGSKFYAGAFDPRQCGAYANATTNTNRAAAIKANLTSYTPCQMFNAYHIYKNNVPQGTYCSLYNAQLSTEWASNTGSWSGRDWFGVRNSWQYQLTVPDSGKCGSN